MVEKPLQPRPRPSYDKPGKSTKLRKKNKNIETLTATKLVDRLMQEGRMPYLCKIRMMSVINTFLEGVKEEIGKGKIVKIQRVGNFYPAILPKREYVDPRTGERYNFFMDLTCMRFLQARSLRKYFRDNFKGITYK